MFSLLKNSILRMASCAFALIILDSRCASRVHPQYIFRTFKTGRRAAPSV